MATRASNKPHVVNFEGHRWVETGVKCPGCNQQISCDITDQRGALECGGPGEGLCGQAALSFDLGQAGWQRTVREYKKSGYKIPSLILCERISDAFDKADNVGKPYLAKANPRRR